MQFKRSKWPPPVALSHLHDYNNVKIGLRVGELDACDVIRTLERLGNQTGHQPHRLTSQYPCLSCFRVCICPYTCSLFLPAVRIMLPAHFLSHKTTRIRNTTGLCGAHAFDLHILLSRLTYPEPRLARGYVEMRKE